MIFSKSLFPVHCTSTIYIFWLWDKMLFTTRASKIFLRNKMLFHTTKIFPRNKIDFCTPDKIQSTFLVLRQWTQVRQNIFSCIRFINIYTVYAHFSCTFSTILCFVHDSWTTMVIFLSPSYRKMILLFTIHEHIEESLYINYTPSCVVFPTKWITIAHHRSYQINPIKR